MSQKKYYHQEVIELQNGDLTNARQLTLKKLRLLNEIFTDHDKEQRQGQKRIEKAIEEAKKADPRVDEDEIVAEVSAQMQAEGAKSYIDVIAEGALLALTSWGVKDQKGKTVEVDEEYVEENLDFPTMSRICEIAGSMELGNKEAGTPGKD